MFELSAAKGMLNRVLRERSPVTGKPEKKEFQSQEDIQSDQNNTSRQMVGNGLRLQTADQIRLKNNQLPKHGIGVAEIAKVADTTNGGVSRFRQSGGKWRKPSLDLPEPVSLKALPENRIGIEHLKNHDLMLLPEDLRFVVKWLARFKKRQHPQILTVYTELWQKAMAGEPLEHKKQNAGRRAANAYLLSLGSIRGEYR